MSKQDYYETLGVSKSADAKTIKKAYRKLACMLTNLHLPKSALMMQVAAFCGLDPLKKAYKEALKKKYRFHTYGDAMLII